MKTTRTERGFGLITFVDFYGSECSLQESSLATEDAVWLGVDKHFSEKITEPSRMHLTREQVKGLLPHLQQFVSTSEIRLSRPRRLWLRLKAMVQR